MSGDSMPGEETTRELFDLSISERYFVISDMFPNMDEYEITIQYHLQQWVGLGLGYIFGYQNRGMFYISKTKPATVNGRVITAQDYFKEFLSDILIDALERKLIYLVKDPSNTEPFIINRYLINEDQFFLERIGTREAISYIQKMVNNV